MRPPADLRPFYKSLAPLLLWQQLPRPVDWVAQFGRSAPLEVEIGSGSGDYLARNAAARRDHDFVGIEMRWASIKRTLRNLAKVEAGNARLVMEDAKPVFERLFGPRSITRIHVLFPCPWRKEKHSHHRLFHRDFLRLLNHRLVDGGEILCVTDWTPFCEWTLAQAAGTGLAATATLIEARYGTKYERKWAGRGQQRFHEIRMTKQAHVDAPLSEDATLNPHHLPDFDADRFAPVDDLGATPINFKEIVRDRERGIVMVRTVVVDGTLTQHLWFMITRANEGGYWIAPARGCQMVPTHGLQRALDRLREAARATAPDA